MKLNISYEKARYIIDVLPIDNIYKIKCKVEKAALIPKPCNAATFTKGQSTLMFNGTVLKDHVVISDIGLVSGQTLQYKVMETRQCKLKVSVKFLKKKIELGTEIEDFDTTSVGNLRVILQNKLGIPMSIFYLTQPEKDHELFDMHGLTYYSIKEGDTLILCIWKGTRGVIVGALNSDISRTMSNLPNFYENPTLNRYLLRVVLFIAAHYDYTKLAALVLQRGIRCEDAIGEYSSRQWCSLQSHPGIFKTPIHQAAQMGSFSCVKMFVRHSPSSMISQDAYRLTPSSYASKYKNFECWKLLIASQFAHARIHGFSLASHARIMHWCTAAKERVNYFKGDGARHSMLLHSTIGKNSNTYLGNDISVAGFMKINKLSKKHWTPERLKQLPSITPINKQSVINTAESIQKYSEFSIASKRGSIDNVFGSSSEVKRHSSNLENHNDAVLSNKTIKQPKCNRSPSKYTPNKVVQDNADMYTSKRVDTSKADNAASVVKSQQKENTKNELNASVTSIKPQVCVTVSDTTGKDISSEDIETQNGNERILHTDDFVAKEYPVTLDCQVKEGFSKTKKVRKSKQIVQNSGKKRSKLKNYSIPNSMNTRLNIESEMLPWEKLTDHKNEKHSLLRSIMEPSVFTKSKTNNIDNDKCKLKRSNSIDSLSVGEKQNEKFSDIRRSSSLLSFTNVEEHARVQILILEATGMTSRDLANECFELGEAFNSRSWMKKFRIAINSSTNRIKRGRPRSAVPDMSGP